MRRSLFVWLAVSSLGATVAFAGEAAPSSAPAPPDFAANVLSSMDRTADPCVDFYQYACGGWLASTKLPGDQAQWVRSFSVIQERNREAVRSLLEEAAARPGDDLDRQRVGHYYAACMDEAAVEKAGVTPLEPILAQIATVKDPASLMRVAGWLQRRGIDVLFNAAVIPDFTNPDLNIAFVLQGGLGMPDRDYYVSDDSTKKQLLADYRTHVEHMFALLGDEPEAAAKHAGQVVAFETELAKVSRDRTAMRDLGRLYNKIDIEGLKKLTPKLPWDVYLAAIGYPGLKDVSVATPEFFQRLEELAGSTDPAVLQTYLRWHAVDETANLLPQRFVDANFAFYGQKLSGQKEMRPRWKRCVGATERAIGEDVGKLYVAKMFPGDSKKVALDMIGDIETAFEQKLPGLAWMDDVTRQRALEKLAALKNKIGYPDHWRDYSKLEVGATSYFANAMAARQFDYDFELAKVGNPVDRSEWNMTPQMVNAYYNPLMNEIVFPAGILQPPFFSREFPAAMNYGAIGGVIGHEMTHGYDDQGRRFDPKGRFHEWWAPEVSARFEKQASCISDYYSKFEVEPGVHVNGALTLGENIADIGGLKQAYAAFKLWEKRHPDAPPAIEGLTNEQLLFVAWGQAWCTVASPEAERLQVTTDPHSPSRFRVDGPMSQNPAFAAAFQCKPGQPMRPEEQCVVW